MSDRWAVGDLALCIKTDGWQEVEGCMPNGAVMPKFGDVFRVNFVVVDDGTWLNLDGCDPVGLFRADRFQKVRPCSPEFAKLVNCVREKVPA